MVNELITNALKHAFPDIDRRGSVTISLHRDPDCVLLIVEDDGVGIPAAVVPGTGTRLVSALMSQLQGTIECRRVRSTARDTCCAFPLAKGRWSFRDDVAAMILDDASHRLPSPAVDGRLP